MLFVLPLPAAPPAACDVDENDTDRAKGMFELGLACDEPKPLNPPPKFNAPPPPDNELNKLEPAPPPVLANAGAR